MQSYTDELFGIGQDKEEAGPSGFINSKCKHRSPNQTYISSKESSCKEIGKRRPAKKKERRRSINIKTFQDALHEVKQSNMLWERCAGTTGCMNFSVANKRGETYQVVITYIP